MYKQYGGFPSGDEWYDIAANQLGSLAYPAVVSQAVSAFETVANAFETGNLLPAQVDLYCQFA